MDVFTLSLWLLRLGFVLLIYVFFFFVARALWQDLRAGVAGAGRPLGRLVVIARQEGRPDRARRSRSTRSTRSAVT